MGVEWTPTKNTRRQFVLFEVVIAIYGRVNAKRVTIYVVTPRTFHLTVLSIIAQSNDFLSNSFAISLCLRSHSGNVSGGTGSPLISMR